MKRILSVIGVTLFAVTSTFAQKAEKGFPDCDSDIKAGIGYCTNMYRNKNLAPGNCFYYFDYGRFTPSGAGGRIGFTFAPEMDGINYCYGLPLAFAWRFSTHSAQDEFNESAFDNEERDWQYYQMNPERDPLADMVADTFMDILARCLSRGEFFLGFTPGVVAGNDNIHTSYGNILPPYISSGNPQGNKVKYREGIISNHRFSFSADLGASLSWRIWRFTLDFTPAIHYLFTDNFRQYSSLEPAPDAPIRWHITFAGGLSFNF